MYSEKEIISRLQKGEDIKTIADEMCKMLNEIQGKYNQEKEEKENKEKIKAEKIAAAANLLKQAREFYETYYCRSADEKKQSDEAFKTLTPEKMIDFLDSVDSLNFELRKLDDSKEVNVNSINQLIQDYKDTFKPFSFFD